MSLRERIDALRSIALHLRTGGSAHEVDITGERPDAEADALLLTDDDLAQIDGTRTAAGALLGFKGPTRTAALLREIDRRAAMSWHVRLAEAAERESLLEAGDVTKARTIGNTSELMSHGESGDDIGK